MPAHALRQRRSAAATLALWFLPLLALLPAGALSADADANATLVRNFVATDALVDGEQERRIHYNGLTAKETSVVGAPDEDGTRAGVTLRQVTDGSGFLQLIYGAEGELRDCEFVAGRRAADAFLRSFHSDVQRAAGGGRREHRHETADAAVANVTFQVLPEGSPLPADVSSWLDMGRLRAQCRDKHRELRRLARWHRRGGPRQRARADLQLNRTKRSLRSMLMAPGTLWCGPNGDVATYGRLGPLSREDRCCRQHDRCRANINAFTTKYHFFNYRPFTISHCHCDHRFRTCLKMAGTGAANLVGKLFFNIVQTKCFVLKPKKVCTRFSWWGKCEKYAYRKQAHLRNNVSY
ncbi:uncharacterized protein LOC126199346 isoform X1 [Schistocerca nitens]|uniref:uncharacterized protein LOC126199346 isoform X1 n=1 Tax=Schistocerca nitens TaxID=7011 RepID=UPI0021185AD4|nr:uncharacterized protein LOC126199346 isoform X1 [Schistocerca nitens]